MKYSKLSLIIRMGLTILCVLLSISCVSVSGDLGSLIPGKKDTLDEKTIIAGLKEALEIGTQNAVKIVSKADGYFKNPEIYIPLPKDLEDFADKLRQIGLKKDVDKFIADMNHSAEEAAKGAVEIFVDAVKKMTLEDARGILHGPDNAATKFFENNTRKKLHNVFFPVIKKAMDQIGITKLYKTLLDTYNKIPGVKKEDYKLDEFITEKALDGLFFMLAKEEKKIRKDPVARVTDLLKKVFGSL
jgi:hypothetical protein